MRNETAEKTIDKLLEEFKKERLNQKLSHEQLAKLAGVHRSTISLLENGKRIPTILTCLKIAEALKISLPEKMTEISKKCT